jgi:hypothetical protein
VEGPPARHPLPAHEREDHQILEITPEEQQHLETIVSGNRKQEIRRQRDRKRKEQKRRSEGVVPRKEYLAESRDNRQHHRTLAKQLKARGMSLRRIGSELGKSSHLRKGAAELGRVKVEKVCPLVWWESHLTLVKQISLNL